jgi:hypothetical protein
MRSAPSLAVSFIYSDLELCGARLTSPLIWPLI